MSVTRLLRKFPFRGCVLHSILSRTRSISRCSQWSHIFDVAPPACPKRLLDKLFILQSGNVMSVGFEKVYLMQNPVNLEVSEVISTYVYKVGLLQTQFSFSTAVGLMNSVVNCIILVLVNFISKKLTSTGLF